MTGKVCHPPPPEVHSHVPPLHLFVTAESALSIPNRSSQPSQYLPKPINAFSQASIKVDEGRAKMKLKDRKEMEEAKERENRIAEEYASSSGKEQNAATTVKA